MKTRSFLPEAHQIHGKGGEQSNRQPVTEPAPPRASIDARSCADTQARRLAQHMRVERRDGETVEQLIRRFNKGVVSERITKTYREKMHFVSKSEQRKEKRRRAERNRRKKMAKGF